MKNKNSKFVSWKAKIITCACLLGLLILSFFFAEPLEKAFGLSLEFDKNEVSEQQILTSDFEVSFLDVGQGNSCFVRFPDGKTMLIDAGTSDYGDDVASFLESKNITKLDYVVASHADSDHIGGLCYIFERFEIENFYRPFQIAGTGDSFETFVPNVFEDLSDIYNELVISTSNRSKISRVTSVEYNKLIELAYTEKYTDNEQLKECNITVFYDGLKIQKEDYSIEFFAPLVREMGVDIENLSLKTKGKTTLGYGTSASNDNSAIFLMTILNNKFLFTGDATWRNNKEKNTEGKFEETDFLLSLTEEEKKNLSNIDVVLAGHHGSSYSTSQELLDLTKPRFLVFSVGQNNSYGHPSSEVIFRAEQTSRIETDYLLRTDTNGKISFVESEGKLVYAVENSAVLHKLEMSWFELSSLIFIFVCIIVISARPIRRTRV